MFCTNCNQEFESGLFCSECGEKLVKKNPNICTSCGSSNSTGWRFCSQCGTENNTTQNPSGFQIFQNDELLCSTLKIAYSDYKISNEEHDILEEIRVQSNISNERFELIKKHFAPDTISINTIESDNRENKKCHHDQNTSQTSNSCSKSIDQQNEHKTLNNNQKLQENESNSYKAEAQNYHEQHPDENQKFEINLEEDKRYISGCKHLEDNDIHSACADFRYSLSNGNYLSGINLAIINYNKSEYQSSFKYFIRSNKITPNLHSLISISGMLLIGLGCEQSSSRSLAFMKDASNLLQTFDPEKISDIKRYMSKILQDIIFQSIGFRIKNDFFESLSDKDKTAASLNANMLIQNNDDPHYAIAFASTFGSDYKKSAIFGYEHLLINDLLIMYKDIDISKVQITAYGIKVHGYNLGGFQEPEQVRLLLTLLKQLWN